MSTNDITGDALTTKVATEAYRDGWDRIFGEKKRCQCVVWSPGCCGASTKCEKENGCEIESKTSG